MADYGLGGRGDSLRRALQTTPDNSGLSSPDMLRFLGQFQGNDYNNMTSFPPNVGAQPSGSAPVPIPTQRPPTMAPPVGPQGAITQPLGAGVNPPGGPPPPSGPVPLPPGPLPMPMTFPAAQGMAGQYAGRPALPPNLAARLMQLGGLGGY